MFSGDRTHHLQPMISEQEMFCLTAIMGHVGELFREFRRLYCEALNTNRPFGRQLHIPTDVNAFYGTGSLHVYGNPAYGQCELVFTPTDVSVSQIMRMMTNSYYTVGLVIDNRIVDHAKTLRVLLQAVPVTLVDQYRARWPF